MREQIAIFRIRNRARAFTPALVGSGWWGYVLVSVATVFWSTSGTFIKIIIQRYGLSPWTLALWRDTLTFLSLLLITVALGAGQLRVARRDLPHLAAVGAIGIAALHVLWAQALVLIPVAVATVLNYTAPAFVVLMTWALWRERPTQRQTFALCLTMAGCILVTRAFDVAQVRLNRLGLLAGLGTGVTYATYMVFSKAALRRYGAWAVVTYAFGFASLTLWLARPAAGLALFRAPWQTWAWMLVLVWVSTVTGFGAFTSGLRYLSASSASIITTLEPVLAAMLAFGLLGEMLSLVQVIGGLLVVWGVLLLTRRRRRRNSIAH